MTLDDFKLLFKKDMINKIPYDNDYNILELSVLNSRYDITEYLLTFSGWDLNHQNYNGETILQYISEQRLFNLKPAQALLNYGNVDKNIVDRWGNNPIWTSTFGYFSTNLTPEKREPYMVWIQLLFNYGFKPNSRTIEEIEELSDPIELKKFYSILKLKGK